MPLTPNQLSLHWNLRFGWGRVCETNNWYVEKLRLAPEAVRAEHSQWHKKVWAFAEVLAAQKSRAVMPDDLRRGAYMLALATPKSLTQFDNADLDRVLIVFKLLVEPDDLRAVKDWIAYDTFDQAKREIARCKGLGIPCHVGLPDDPGERRRHLYFISKTPEAVLRHFIRQRFGGRLPEDMTLKELRQVTSTLKNRRDYSPRNELNAHTPAFIGEVPANTDNVPF